MDKEPKITKSFLKWAGGKSKLLSEIFSRLPPGSRLIEPFMGSGVVFLNSSYDLYLGGDVNADLVDLYQMLESKESSSLIEDIKSLFCPENNERERFYELRECFNNSKDKRERAALFVYLNRHAFNGLCRYNSLGRFNVPFGDYKQVLCPEDSLRMFSSVSKTKNAEFRCGDFEPLLKEAKEGDVVYCDPPYAPLSPTASFASYASGGFGKGDQERLATQSKDAASRGAFVLISNHDTEWVRDLYAGASIHSLLVHRSVSCKGDGRGPAPEIMALFSPKG